MKMGAFTLFIPVFIELIVFNFLLFHTVSLDLKFV